MPEVYLGVGSNIDPEQNIPAALHALSRAAKITGVSSFYRTRPLGAPGDPAFYNGVVRIETDLEPDVLRREVLRAIEDGLGRVRTADPNSPRPIDLDIIIYGDRVSSDDGIELPAPDIRNRAFVAVPLLELAPGMVMPDTGTPLEEIVGHMDCGGLEPLPQFSMRLAEEFADEPRTR